MTRILFTIICICTFLPIFGPKDFEITQAFHASSSRYGVDYNITITGEVKNVTTETMYNVRFKVTLENDESYGKADIETIDEIAPGEIVRVQGLFIDNEGYDSIHKIEYSINGGEYKTLSQISDIMVSIVMAVLAVVLWIIYIVSVVKYKKRKNQSQEAVGGNVFGGPISTSNGEVLTSPFAPQAPVQQAPQAPQAKICQYCGSKIPAEETKCPGCGAKL